MNRGILWLMPNALLELSQTAAAAVESASRSVASVQGNPRFGSSGVLWSPGVLVSAEHALADVDKVEVILPQGHGEAQIAGRDRATGIAVFRLDHQVAAPVPADATALRAGSLALVVGRSLRSGPTASMGILSSVSGRWRTRFGGDVDQFLQLDISIYPTAEGGAVVDAEGKLIGIASSSFSRYGAVAIPAATVQRVVDAILAQGHVARGYLGIGLREVAIAGEQKSGLIVLSVEERSSAAAAGLLMGDVLTALDGTPLRDAEQLQALLGSDSVGSKRVASVIRAGQAIEVAVTIGTRRREA